MEEKSVLNAEIPEGLRRQVKAHAALSGVTVSEFVAVALQKAIDEIDRAEGAVAGGGK